MSQQQNNEEILYETGSKIHIMEDFTDKTLDASFRNFSFDAADEDDDDDIALTITGAPQRLAPPRSWLENNRQVSFSQSTDPKPLGLWSASFILINMISMGYILNPTGKL